MRTFGVTAEPILLELRSQIWPHKRRLGEIPQPLLMLGDGFHITECRVVTQQPIGFLAHGLGYGLIAGQFLEKRSSLQ
ncbi:hypothetical protein Y887_07425 [Xanthomonas pisi DSM 18956]|nr:hypothetical protein Y887_07425 [Xanthomonas pisi DSM 18956]